MAKKKRYVLGLIFSQHGSRLALLRKTHPDWQAGLLNGVGGHIEPGELPIEAMVREAKEEVGLNMPMLAWYEIAKLTKPNVFELFVFKVYLPAPLEPDELVGQEEEQVELVYTANPLPAAMIPNLKYLIPFALHMYDGDYLEVDCV